VAEKSKKKANGRGAAKKSAGKKKTTIKKDARSAVTGRFVTVAPKSNSWVVKREGSSRSRVYNTQADAITAATKTARNSQLELRIQRSDGTLRAVSTSRADSLMLGVWKSARKANTTSGKR
jgi:Uncharacterized protein conserved in bacteria (DUF2188)